MNLKLLLEPKEMLKLIPENKIYYNFLYIIVGIYFILPILSIIFYYKLASKDVILWFGDIKNFFAATSALNIILSFVFVVAILLVCAALYVSVLSLLTKLVLLFFKKRLNFFKIANIILYSQITQLLINLSLALIFIMVFKLLNLSGDISLSVLDKMRLFGSEKIGNATRNLTTLFSFLLAIVFYIYLVKIAAKDRK